MRTVLLGFLMLSACGVTEETTVDNTSAATVDVSVTFKADWTTSVQGVLSQGKRLRITYANERAQCSGTLNGGGPAWNVTAFYRWNGGAVASTYAAGHNADPSAPLAGIALDRVGTLEIWFQHTNVSGCMAWDSNFGKNYIFKVGAVAPSDAPGWLGNAQFAIDRATCNGGVCSDAWHPLDGGFIYGTWARQRAALRVAGFEVWKSGITDFDNGNLWRQLDAQVRYRFVGEAAYRSEYVNFDKRWGNNAHYQFDLRAHDPFEWPAGANIHVKADCPTFVLRKDSSGQLVQADMEFYFVVNGSELRAANGQPFRGGYQDYIGNYAVCL
jgi:hypothetical protein